MHNALHTYFPPYIVAQRRLDTITCDGNYYGLIAFHNTVKGVMYGESGFV